MNETDRKKLWNADDADYADLRGFFNLSKSAFIRVISVFRVLFSLLCYNIFKETINSVDAL